MKATVSGHCLCGAVAYETDGAQNWAGYCHCASCRRNCAAPVAAFFGVPNGHWRWTGVDPAIYRSSPGAARLFCDRCGTPMAYATDAAPDEIHFYAATMADPASYRPEVHYHVDEALPWLAIADELPRQRD
ncbi:GFA family protein [Tropicimonas sp. IMCC34043]|uniref:GFA family protein n=1 Tax=Tropicimonas sp. IMCC34043 TaxID=2248760 RepID=UPI001E53C471|nr:GFA family protein [Tropicimonas sp. IMCC34043]